MLIALAIPKTGDWYYDAVHLGAVEAAREAGADIRLLVEPLGDAGRANVVERWHEDLADEEHLGAVSVGFEFAPTQRDRLLEHGKPVVVVGGRAPGLPSVFIDDVAAARRATQHLLDLGHREVTHLAGYARSSDDFTMRRDRIRGYSDAMRDAGLEAGSHIVPSGLNRDDAYRAAHGLLAEPDRPTAVFAVTDVLAAAVLAAARDHGIEVPRHLSVIGIDDGPHAAAAGLTTLRQDPVGQGAAAVHRVLGRTTADEQVFDVEVVVRGSTGVMRGTEPPRRSLLRTLLRRRATG